MPDKASTLNCRHGPMRSTERPRPAWSRLRGTWFGMSPPPACSTHERESNDDWPKDSQNDIGDGVWHGDAEDWRLTLGNIAGAGDRGIDGHGARQRATDDDRVHSQDP